MSSKYPPPVKWIFTAMFFFLVFWFLSPGFQPPTNMIQDFSFKESRFKGATSGPYVSMEHDSLDTSRFPPISDRSLTAILPVTIESLPILETILVSFLKPSTHIHEILVVCPEAMISRTRSLLQKTTSGLDHPDILLHPLADGLDQHSGAMNAVSQASTDWVLLMDQQGLLQQTDYAKNMLLRPPATPIPVGPRGILVSAGGVSCIPTSNISQGASYLYPPFVMPSFLAISELQKTGSNVWENLGQRVSESRPDGYGGMVPSLGYIDMNWCPSRWLQKPFPPDWANPSSWNLPVFHGTPSNTSFYDGRYPIVEPNHGFFVAFLPSLQDLRFVSTLTCALRKSGHRVEIFIYDEPDGLSDKIGWEARIFQADQCDLPHYILPGCSPLLATRRAHLMASGWMDMFDRPPNIIIMVPIENDVFDGFSGSVTQKNDYLRNSVVVRIPRDDLPYCEWMGALSLAEWKSWNVPQVEISIITKDRPRSLARLLSSLYQGRFFGDTVNLRVHLEQSSDPETMKMIQNIQWDRGCIFLHHRIVHGGLLPAVVESWYPRSNDTYGLLLEDDIELSPLFYGWVKMSLLRYRHGDLANRSPRMFGVSLYQQKNVELPPEGRRAFNARNLFFDHGLPDVSTPYLSPVPCSWGAVYFPEHWREFHAYLSVRLSKFSNLIDQTVVPGVRSNNWKKSWKKYFIEMVYLRGYVMLYPNYEGFVSLSTNHLEVGSHVKIRTKEKKELFLLPLMQLPLPPSSSPFPLLQLPHNTLPSWETLPVLNLTGSLTTLKDLEAIGRLQWTKLTGCTEVPALFDITDPVCIVVNPPV